MGEALANLILSVLLVRRFGMLGVAVGTAVPVLVANLFVLLPIACRQFGMTTGAFLRRVLPAPAAGVLPAIALCVLLRSQYPPTSVVWILAEASLVGAVYLITVVTIGLERTVRSRYAEHVRRVPAGGRTSYGRGPVTRQTASVTVIIATFNRAALLDECLEHLRAQSFKPGDEVIVVDNGSTDDTPGVVARHQAAFPVPMHLLRETVPGKSLAVSRAVAFANGDILVFTDDDVNVGARLAGGDSGGDGGPGGRARRRTGHAAVADGRATLDPAGARSASPSRLAAGPSRLRQPARRPRIANGAWRQPRCPVGGVHAGRRVPHTPWETARHAAFRRGCRDLPPACSRQGSRRSTCRAPGWLIGCPPTVPASRISSAGSTGRASPTR